MKQTDTESTANRPMFFENRPIIIRAITIIPVTHMSVSSVARDTDA